MAAAGSIKIIVIGDVNTGKTSFCQRYANGTFTTEYKATVGVDFVVKGNFQLWDVAGQERFAAVTAAYYRGAAGALVVLDWNEPASLASAQKWIEDLRKKYTDDIPILIVANKCDLPGRLSVEDLDAMCKGNTSIVGWIAASAKTGIGVEDAMKNLSEHFQRHPISDDGDEDAGIIKLGSGITVDNENWTGGRCC